MAVSVPFSGEMRDLLHNSNDQELYKAFREYFITTNEGFKSEAYYDGKENITIGYGFNMKRDKAKKEWDKAFQGAINFDDAYNNKVKITKAQALVLFDVSIKNRRKEVKKYYDIDKLKLNELLAVEDLYYCGPKLAGKDTNFRKLMNLYTKTSDPEYLKEAVDEVLYRSNKERITGMQNRRDAQAEMLNSLKVPLYSRPNEPLIPNKKIIAKIGETIIPKNYSNGKEINPEYENKYYIWRTQGDSKVRNSHLLKEGKIFGINDTNFPGKDYNCRCVAEPIPEGIQILTAQKNQDLLNFINIKCIVDDIQGYINFHSNNFTR